MNYFKHTLLIFIPRFIEEYVVGEMVDDDTFQPACSIEDVEPHEIFQHMVKVKTFTWLNFSFPTQMGLLEDFDYQKATQNTQK